MKIALIGFMGSGKSTVAKELGGRLALPVFELDEEILAASGRASVNEIFDRDGEARFREIEHEVCRALEEENALIISCGGGVIHNDENILSLKRGAGVVIYLRTRFDTVSSRLRGDAARPLFKDLSRAQALYSAREAKYVAAADVIVDTDQRTPAQVAEEIISALKT